MTKLIIPLLLFLFPVSVVTQVGPSGKHPGKQPLARTYSIVARDPETGQPGECREPLGAEQSLPSYF
jgi:hypothetical protein